jgi:hypothetical protein
MQPSRLTKSQIRKLVIEHKARCRREGREYHAFREAVRPDPIIAPVSERQDQSNGN